MTFSTFRSGKFLTCCRLDVYEQREDVVGLVNVFVIS
ncbi:hypothetical protein T02_13563 [Trichinella nativa]|uniref:Uncharacterized protein n=1 Tax=Trichinella nativa TaxID=6335 RepID=A0A0V1KJ34_9BILA|nr:hypothetical protein T02_13563 [Trichinella nativa]